MKLNEHIDIKCSDRLKIEGRAHRTANGVTIDDPIGAHTINDLYNFLYSHAVRSVAEKAKGERERSAEVLSVKFLSFKSPRQGAAARESREWSGRDERHVQ